MSDLPPSKAASALSSNIGASSHAKNRASGPTENLEASDAGLWPEIPPTWKLPSVKDRWEERKEGFTDKKDRRNAWTETAKNVEAYSERLIRRWNGEIDTLLVYAGLFSSILTAFNVQTYQLLTPDPPDPVLATLQQISAQLSSFSVNPPFVNSTQPPLLSQVDTGPPAERWAVILNVLWFSSLIFSLSAASLGILVKQWLNEYNDGLSGSSPQIARLRQYRLNNLQKWRVGTIVALLPILLQIALLLFFAGLLVLLYHLNNVVAISSSALISLFLVVNLGTALLPAFKADCCYLSPPAYAFFILARPVKAALFVVRRALSDGLDYVFNRLPGGYPDVIQAVSLWIWTTEEDYKYTSLRSWEMNQVGTSTRTLDAEMVAIAYTTTMDPGYLDYATLCFAELSPEHVVHSFSRMHTEHVRHWHEAKWVYAEMPAHIWSDVSLAVRLEKAEYELTRKRLEQVTQDLEGVTDDREDVREDEREVLEKRKEVLEEEWDGLAKGWKDLEKAEENVGRYLAWSHIPEEAPQGDYYALNISSATGLDPGGQPLLWARDSFSWRHISLSERSYQRLYLVVAQMLEENAPMSEPASFKKFAAALCILIACIPSSRELDAGKVIYDTAAHALKTLAKELPALPRKEAASTDDVVWPEDTWREEVDALVFSLYKQRDNEDGMQVIPTEIFHTLVEYIKAYEKEYGEDSYQWPMVKAWIIDKGKPVDQ